MWILVLILFQPWPLPTTGHKLLDCTDYKHCLRMQEFVMREMTVAYPDDKDFQISCRWTEHPKARTKQ